MIELEQENYEIFEDDELDVTLQICIILNGEIETPITIMLTSVNITATGKFLPLQYVHHKHIFFYRLCRLCSCGG